MTIYEIKRLTADKYPHFFSRKTMRFFRQTLKMFKVKKLNEYEYLIYAIRPHGYTEHIFNAKNNSLTPLHQFPKKLY